MHAWQYISGRMQIIDFLLDQCSRQNFRVLKKKVAHSAKLNCKSKESTTEYPKRSINLVVRAP
jgi:hypothetical protein